MSNQVEPVKAESTQMVYEKRVPWILHGIVSIILLAVAFGIVAKLFGSKPKAGRWGERPAPSVAVEIAPLQLESYDVWVDSYGTAEALTSTRLVAEISGRVVNVSESIRAGGTFNKGDVLVEVDARDFEVEVDITASLAADAEVVYLQEVAQAEFAAQEWNETPTSEAARQLALRKPQVAAAKASLQAAKARLSRAKLNLERTRIVAPFDGKILEQLVDVGQVVSPSQTIAQIYSTDAVEVRLPVKLDDLEHLQLPESEGLQAIPSRVVLESDMGSRTYQWQGEIVRTEGAFDPATRMLYVVARVDDPFIANADRPAMRVGQFVRAKLQGKQYDDVFVIPRRAVSQDFLVSVADEGVLKKRRIQPLWTDSNAVVVSADNLYKQARAGELELGNQNLALNISDMLILTPTANLPQGTRVKSLTESRGPQRRGDLRPTIAAETGAGDSESSGDVAEAAPQPAEAGETGVTSTAVATSGK